MAFFEVKFVVQNGDNLEHLIDAALDVVKVRQIVTAYFVFNDCKIFVNRKSTKESVMDEYQRKLKQLYA